MRWTIALAAAFLTSTAWAEDLKPSTHDRFPDTRWGASEGGVEANADGAVGKDTKPDIGRVMSDVIDVFPIEATVPVEAASVYPFVCVLRSRLGTELEEPLDGVNYIRTADDRPIREGRPCVYHYKAGAVLGYVRAAH